MRSKRARAQEEINTLSFVVCTHLLAVVQLGRREKRKKERKERKGIEPKIDKAVSAKPKTLYQPEASALFLPIFRFRAAKVLCKTYTRASQQDSRFMCNNTLYNRRGSAPPVRYNRVYFKLMATPRFTPKRDVFKSITPTLLGI